MKEKTIDIWKGKLDWIAKNNGMALVNAHPDYMTFDRKKSGIDQYPVKYYEDFLVYIKTKYHGQYWHSSPKETACYWLHDVVNPDFGHSYQEICRAASHTNLDDGLLNRESNPSDRSGQSH